MKKILRSSEFFVALVVMVLCIIIGLINPVFFSWENLFDLLRSGVVTGILALGCLIVIVSGGTDVSFATIAIFAAYLASKILIAWQFDGTVLVAFLLSAAIGTVLGLFNGALIAWFRLPTMIVTLGTSSIFRGAMLVFIGTFIINKLPQGILAFGQATLAQVSNANGAVIGLPVSVVIFFGAAVLVWLMMKYTMLGRGIYALGGDRVAAERAGLNVIGIQLFIYGLVGFLAGISGVVHASLVRNVNPFDLIGTEMNVIAAVVLGGARITGGRGTVFGTILGVMLVVIMNNSLILLGIPSYWQRAAIGVLILLGTGITAWQSKRESAANLLES
ncbi:MAG TPA: sugar ABC transporter permease [Firmicutes bacterium]|jgi:simple sugar transport system permease protein|nr:sugar ABC transporter permease [Bacillota bacterium]HBL51419.1 sugar ABC transporter permease [Bacillota bacterium]HBR24101.1 sugar ABC transporter permease [Bacillota bacterium]